RITAVPIFVGGPPVRILTVFGAKPIGRKLCRPRVNYFGHSRSLDLIESLPDGADTLTFQMTNDDLSEIGFPGWQFIPGERAEPLEVLGIHELGNCHIERWDSPVGVVSSHGASIESCRLDARRASFFACARRNRSSTEVTSSGEGFPNRFRYRFSIYALRGIFHSSCS